MILLILTNGHFHINGDNAGTSTAHINVVLIVLLFWKQIPEAIDELDHLFKGASGIVIFFSFLIAVEPTSFGRVRKTEIGYLPGKLINKQLPSCVTMVILESKTVILDI